MPFFQYKAVSPAGEVQEGVLEASSTTAAVSRLQSMGLIPIRAQEASSVKAAPGAPAAPSYFARRRGITQSDIGVMTRELATLLRAGLPLDRALELLITLAPSLPVAVMLQGIRDEVRGGKALSQALDARRDVFSRFYVNIVRAGEAGGALGTVLQRLADTMERTKELRDSVRSALIYPTILVFVAVASVMVLLIYVVPQFQSTFAQAGKALPIPTQIVIVAGTFLRNWWWAVLPAAGLLVLAFRRRGRIPSVRRLRDARLLRMPLVGDLIAKVEVARFARTLATLLANGVTLLAGLSIVKETMGNVVLSNALDGVTAKLREGKGFGRPLAETELFPRLATQMILVGEESGRLEEMLARVADVYDREVATAIKRFLAVLEPVLILGLAVMVGGIVFSILLGVMGMSELVI